MSDPYQTMPSGQPSMTGSSGNETPTGIRDDAEAAEREAEGVGQDVKDAAHRMKREAQNAMHNARESVKGYAAEQKAAAAGRVHGVASALRQAADNLDTQDQQLFAGYARQAASSIDQASEALRNRDVGDFVEAVEDFARRQPVVFLGGAFITGLLIARFMKSSAERSYEDSRPFAGSEMERPGSRPMSEAH